MRFGAILVFFAVMVILNLLSSSSCNQLLKKTRTLEQQIDRLEDERASEASRWEKLKTPEGIERALRGLCLPMKVPRSNQTVIMAKDGKPRPGQVSVAEANRRNKGVTAFVGTRGRQTYRRENRH